MLNNGLQNSTKCSYSADTSFVEPEILKEMGVGMLEDIVNYESTQRLQSQECVTSPTNMSSKRKFLMNEISEIDCHEEIHTSSISDTIHTERFVSSSI